MASPAPSSPSRTSSPPSPRSATGPSGSSSRKRERSTRVVVTVLLLVLAALAVVAAWVSGSWAVAAAAAAAAFVLGVVGVRLMQVETADARRAWAADRATQARDYRAITERRTMEQAVQEGTLIGRMAKKDATINRLERRLTDATDEVRAAHQRLETEQARLAETTRRHDDLLDTAADAERVRERLSLRLDDAETRAAEAIVRVAELEQELEIVLAEWRSGVSAPRRKHA